MRICAPADAASSVVSAFTAACVATGTSVGGRTAPCGVSRRPARARERFDSLRIVNRIMHGSFLHRYVEYGFCNSAHCIRDENRERKNHDIEKYSLFRVHSGYERNDGRDEYHNKAAC